MMSNECGAITSRHLGDVAAAVVDVAIARHQPEMHSRHHRYSAYTAAKARVRAGLLNICIITLIQNFT